MPFDGNDYLARPAQPDGAYLVRVLREGPTGPLWPADFKWNYLSCGTCALGLAGRIWSILFPNLNNIAAPMGLDRNAATPVFLGLMVELQMLSGDITPAMVADALEAALAQRTETVL